MTKTEQAMQSIAILKNMGLQVLEESRNTLKIAMPKEGNGNHLGGVYAGAIFTLAEFPFGVMCVNRFSTDEIVPVVGEVTIRFMAPASGTLTVALTISDQEWDEIERETKLHGKCKVVKDIEIKDAQGKINAVAKATYFTLAVKK